MKLCRFLCKYVFFNFSIIKDKYYIQTCIHTNIYSAVGVTWPAIGCTLIQEDFIALTVIYTFIITAVGLG